MAVKVNACYSSKLDWLANYITLHLSHLADALIGMGLDIVGNEKEGDIG
jgi:hypothetical protein